MTSTGSWAMVEATPTKVHLFRFPAATPGIPRLERAAAPAAAPAAALRAPLPLLIRTTSYLLEAFTAAPSLTTAI